MNSRSRVLILVSILLVVQLPNSASGEEGRQSVYDVNDIIITPSGILLPGMDITVEIHVEEFSSRSLSVSACDVYMGCWGDGTYDLGKVTLDKEIVTLNWTLPNDITNGEYELCVEGMYVCGYFEVDIYSILPAQTQMTITPGDDITASVSFVNPRNGGPVTPDKAEYMVSYLDSDGKERHVVRQLEGSSDTITFAVPETICYNEYTCWRDLTIEIWANASTNQSAYASIDFVLAWPELQVTEPASLEEIPLTKPFHAVAFAQEVDSTGGWATYWSPVKGALIDVTINQSGESEKIGDDLATDSAGRLSTVFDLSSVNSLVAEAATLSFSWRPSSDQDRIWIEVPVILTKDSDSTASTGGINLEVTDWGEDLTKGGKTTVSILVADDSNRPITDTWLQYTLQRTREVVGVDGTSDSWSAWSAVKTDSNGVASIEVTAPSDLVPGIDELTLMIYGWNKSGGVDYINVGLGISEPRIKSDVTPEFWVPGETVNVELEFEEMSAPITIWWTIAQLERDEWTSFSATTGTISIEIPSTLPDRSDLYWDGQERLTMIVMAVDGGGDMAAERIYINELSGLRLQATPVNKVSSAGENFEVDVTLSTLGETEMPDGPYSWEVIFMEDVGLSFSGELDEPTGTISIPISDHMSTGTQIASITMGGVQSIIVVEIRSVEDSTGVKGLASSANLALSPASPIVSFIALFIAVVCLLLILRNGGKNRDEEPFSSGNLNQLSPPNTSLEPSFGMSPPPSPAQTAAMPPPPAQTNPSRQMAGSVGQDGYEWLQHEGKTWYRTANSGQEWNQWI